MSLRWHSYPKTSISQPHILAHASRKLRIVSDQANRKKAKTIQQPVFPSGQPLPDYQSTDLNFLFAERTGCWVFLSLWPYVQKLLVRWDIFEAWEMQAQKWLEVNDLRVRWNIRPVGLRDWWIKLENLKQKGNGGKGQVVFWNSYSHWLLTSKKREIS